MATVTAHHGERDMAFTGANLYIYNTSHRAHRHQTCAKDYHDNRYCNFKREIDRNTWMSEHSGVTQPTPFAVPPRPGPAAS